MLFTEGNDTVQMEFSSIPEYFEMKANEAGFSYTTTPKGLPGASRQVLRRFQMRSSIGEQWMFLTFYQIPHSFSVGILNNSFCIEGAEAIGSIELFVTNDGSKPLKRLKNNFAVVWQKDGYTHMGARFQQVERIYYNPSELGVLELQNANESEMNVIFHSDYPKNVDSEMILRPLPKNIHIELPGVIDQAIPRFPDLVNLTGIVDFTNVVFGIADIAEDMIGLIGNITENLVNALGGIGDRISFEYDLGNEGSMDVIGRITVGDPDSLPDVNWTHGLMLVYDDTGETVNLKANIFLQGLPREGSISTRMNPDDILLELDFKSYSPRYDWVYFDTRGLQKRDLMMYMNGFPSTPFDLKVNIDLYTNMSIGGDIRGRIDMESSHDLGQVYVKLYKYVRIDAVTEVLVSQLPKRIGAAIDMTSRILIDYNATTDLDYVMFRISKFLDNEWHTLFGILHDVPVFVKMDIMPNRDFDIDTPIPLQGLPRIEIRTELAILDIFVELSGRALGQRGEFTINIIDASNTDMVLKGNRYSIHSNGIGFIDITARNYPLLESYRLDTLLLLATDLTNLEIELQMIFGLYPQIIVTHIGTGAVEIYMDVQFMLLGRSRF